VSVVFELIGITIAGLGAVASVVIAFSWVLARVWCKPKREVPSRTPGDHGLPFEPMTYSSQGVPISGRFIPLVPAPSPPPAVVLTHGLGEGSSLLAHTILAEG
jgi:hypothetical protein